MMSSEVIQQVVQELEGLSESDQRHVLSLLAALRRDRTAAATSSSPVGDDSALALKNGLIVFTGKVEGSEIDWLRLLREEREEELMTTMMVQTPGQ